MHTYIVIKSFSGALGTFKAGESVEFENGPAYVLLDKGIIADVDSPEHNAFLASQDAAAKAAAAAEKLATEKARETKPTLASVRANKAK